MENIHQLIEDFNQHQEAADSDSKKLRLRNGPHSNDTYIEGKIVYEFNFEF